jgi:iron-sulfur cluster assembly accessory protein
MMKAFQLIKPLHVLSRSLVLLRNSSSSISSAMSAAQERGNVRTEDLVLTPNALSRLSLIRGRARSSGLIDADSYALRVRVDSGGCSGFRYEFAVEPMTPNDDDAAFGRDGCFAVIDAASLELLKGATIDWEDSLMRSAFTVTSNPNADAACGCKMSFSPKAQVTPTVP